MSTVSQLAFIEQSLDSVALGPLLWDEVHIWRVPNLASGKTPVPQINIGMKNHRELKRYVIGKDPFNLENHSLRPFRDVYSDVGQIQSAALSDIEFACSDIMGKATKPLSHAGFLASADRSS
jgi:hypothetical protein